MNAQRCCISRVVRWVSLRFRCVKVFGIRMFLGKWVLFFFALPNLRRMFFLVVRGQNQDFRICRIMCIIHARPVGSKHRESEFPPTDRSGDCFSKGVGFIKIAPLSVWFKQH